MARVVVGFRSGPSRKPCLLNINNNSARRVYVIWLDYYGREVNYGLVEPGTFKKIQSFEGHLWICRDSTTKRRLLLNKVTYFVPTAALMNAPSTKIVNNMPLLDVFVHIQLFSLVNLGVDAVSRLVTSDEELEDLELPMTVKRQVALCYHNSKIVIPEPPNCNMNYH